MASDDDDHIGDEFLNDNDEQDDEEMNLIDDDQDDEEEQEQDLNLINDDGDEEEEDEKSTSSAGDVTVAVAGTPTVTTAVAPPATATPSFITPSTTVVDSRRLFQRLWTDEDEIELLQGYYDYITSRGMTSSHHHTDTTAFYDEIKGKLQLEFNKNQLVEKLRRLKKKYRNVVAKISSGKDYVFKTSHDQATFDISCRIWNDAVVTPVAVNGVEDDDNVGFNLNDGNGIGNENGDLNSFEKKVRPRKRVRTSGVKIEEGFSQPQTFGHGLGTAAGAGGSDSVTRNVVEETVKSCLSPLFKELVNGMSNGGSRGLGLGLGSGLGGLNLDAFAIGDMNDEKWRKQHMLELEVYLKRLELMQDQIKSRLDELKSMSS